MHHEPDEYFGFITLAMAMFALPEALYLVLDPARSKTDTGGGEVKDLRITRDEAKAIAPSSLDNPYKAF